MEKDCALIGLSQPVEERFGYEAGLGVPARAAQFNCPVRLSFDVKAVEYLGTEMVMAAAWIIVLVLACLRQALLLAAVISSNGRAFRKSARYSPVRREHDHRLLDRS